MATDERKINVGSILGSFKTRWKNDKKEFIQTDEMTKEESAALNKVPELLQKCEQYKKLEYEIIDLIDESLVKIRNTDPDEEFRKETEKAKAKVKYVDEAPEEPEEVKPKPKKPEKKLTSMERRRQEALEAMRPVLGDESNGS